MGVRWSTSQVTDLAPDEPSIRAGLEVAGSPGWAGEGCAEDAVWAEAPGSGARRYHVVIDLSGPAFSCSCPSRKFPCKHAIGILLRWSRGDVPAAAAPPHAASWLASRAARSARAARTTRPPGAAAADPEAAARRARQREARVASGIDELERWLRDQIRNGAATTHAAGYAAVDGIAARMVDAQAPGLARSLRGIAGLLAQSTWPSSLLEELALLSLLVEAYRQLPQLDSSDPQLAAVIRAHIGFTTTKESVLAAPGVRDTWSIYARHDDAKEDLISRTVWLQGGKTGRMATVLSFAPPGGVLDNSLTPGRAFVGDLHFYPGDAHRALVGTQVDELSAQQPIVGSLDEALTSVAQSLAVDPWTRSVPVWVLGVLCRAAGDRWALADRSGRAIPLRTEPGWAVLAATGADPAATLTNWTPRGWEALSIMTRDDAVESVGR